MDFTPQKKPRGVNRDEVQNVTIADTPIWMAEILKKEAKKFGISVSELGRQLFETVYGKKRK